jgi:hypothetical protein
MSHEFLDDALNDVDWRSLEEVHEAAQKVFPTLAIPANLSRLWDRMMNDERLIGAAESFNTFQKFVLHDNTVTGLRIRLHRFNDRRIEETHNHRASFSAWILRGSYRHFLYGNVEDLWGDTEGPARPLEPRLIQDQLPGTSYTLHHAFIHSTQAMPGTVSLVIQGPRIRSSFRIYDQTTQTTRTRFGAGQASGVQEPGERRLQPAEVAAVRAHLIVQGVLT